MISRVAHKLLSQTNGVCTYADSSLAMPQFQAMNKEFKTRFVAVLLTLLTVAAAVFAWINFQKEAEFQLPYDGAWWVESAGQLVAEVPGPGAVARPALAVATGGQRFYLSFTI